MNVKKKGNEEDIFEDIIFKWFSRITLVSGSFFFIKDVMEYIALDGDVNRTFKLKIILSSFLMLMGIITLIYKLAHSGGQIKSGNRCISRAPGSGLLVIVEYFYSPKIVEQVFKPIVADWRTEYFDVLKEGKNRKASWIKIRYTFSFFMAMGLSKVLSVIRSMAHR
jgi:hypothetical protein